MLRIDADSVLTGLTDVQRMLNTGNLPSNLLGDDDLNVSAPDLPEELAVMIAAQEEYSQL